MAPSCMTLGVLLDLWDSQGTEGSRRSRAGQSLQVASHRLWVRVRVRHHLRVAEWVPELLDGPSLPCPLQAEASG